MIILNKVLIIADDASAPNLLKTQLDSLGFDTIQADSPAEGIQKARETSPDVVILDFTMPIYNGLNVCKALREFSEAPILVLSIIDQPMIAAKVLDAGADDYMVKPVADSILQARLRRIHERRHPPLTQPNPNGCHPED